MTSEEWGKREEEDHLRGHFCEKKEEEECWHHLGPTTSVRRQGKKSPPPCPALSSSLAVQEISPPSSPHSFFQSNAAVQLRKRKRRRGEGVISASNVAVAVVFARGGGSGEDLQQPRKRKVGSFALPSLPLFWKVPPLFLHPTEERGEEAVSRKALGKTWRGRKLWK